MFWAGQNGGNPQYAAMATHHAAAGAAGSGPPRRRDVDVRRLRPEHRQAAEPLHQAGLRDRVDLVARAGLGRVRLHHGLPLHQGPAGSSTPPAAPPTTSCAAFRRTASPTGTSTCRTRRPRRATRRRRPSPPAPCSSSAATSPTPPRSSATSTPPATSSPRCRRPPTHRATPGSRRCCSTAPSTCRRAGPTPASCSATTTSSRRSAATRSRGFHRCVHVGLTGAHEGTGGSRTVAPNSTACSLASRIVTSATPAADAVAPRTLSIGAAGAARAATNARVPQAWERQHPPAPSRSTRPPSAVLSRLLRRRPPVRRRSPDQLVDGSETLRAETARYGTLPWPTSRRTVTPAAPR